MLARAGAVLGSARLTQTSGAGPYVNPLSLLRRLGVLLGRVARPRSETAVESPSVIRFFIQFLLLQVVLFGAELTPWAQDYFVVPWTNTLAAVSARLVTFFDPGVVM